jgi:hypothetical protein
MPPRPDLLTIAQTEYDDAARALATHLATCRPAPCNTCRTLARHLSRTRQQITLLTPQPQTGALFDA